MHVYAVQCLVLFHRYLMYICHLVLFYAFFGACARYFLFLLYLMLCFWCSVAVVFGALLVVLCAFSI